ncbi:MAG: fumarate hydratase [Sphaerochaetaceae bacterium]
MSVSLDQLTLLITQHLIKASQELEEPLVKQLHLMREKTHKALLELPQSETKAIGKTSSSLEVLDAIITNLELSQTHHIPMCQDTGMVVGVIEMGKNLPVSMHDIESAIIEGIKEAETKGLFRFSVVDDPLYERVNLNTNAAPILYWETSEHSSLTIHLMLKGFGSENCSRLVMLNPTSTPKDVIASVAQAVQDAQGKPCPPVVVGVGLGGTAERSLLLSKKALFRETGKSHVDSRYAELESALKEAIDHTTVGPGGFGGPFTALAVAVETEPTHIAGLPVGISISCWADRKTTISIGYDHD